MHMADALLSPAVATTMYVASAAAAGTSIYKLRQEDKLEVKLDYGKEKLPTMAVMSALVFAGQMINYTIPGTGSSGHLCGGMMLSALLGPYAGFLSMVVILAIQGLFFADGGLMALGANCWNMAFYGCFIGYFLIYKPIIKSRLGNMRLKLILASILGCVITLQLGAFSVCIETLASGITELPFAAFAALMQPIHLAIGLIEGLITAAVLLFVYQTRPAILEVVDKEEPSSEKMSLQKVLLILGVAVVLVGGIGSQFASSNPDGLEWSLFGNADGGYNENMGLDEEEIASRVKKAAFFCGIDGETLGMSPFEISGGQKRRAAIAGVVAMQPEFLVLDEPAAGLDPMGKEEIFDGLVKYKEETGATLALISHSMEDIAKYSDNILVLKDGKVFMSGEVEEIFADAEKLFEASLDVPQITKLFIELKKRGVVDRSDIYTVGYAAKTILNALDNK